MSKHYKNSYINQITLEKLLDLRGYLIYMITNTCDINDGVSEDIIKLCAIIDRISPYLT